MTDQTTQPEPEEDPVEAARARAQASLQAERGGVERRRVRRFLTVMIGLLALSWLGVVASIASGDLTVQVAVLSVAVMGFMTLTTGLGWLSFKRDPESGGRVVALVLYIAALVPLFFFYVSGEFESMALGLVLIPVVMAPMFTAKRHAWGIAASLAVLYLLLVTARHYDVIPYGYMVPGAQELMVQNPAFLADTVAGFLILVFSLAYLAGQASLDILTSQKDLEGEVDRQTRRLARTNAELNDRNRALDEFNAALSHDLKSPLTTTLLAAESLLYSDPPPTQEARETLEMICNSTERMADLVRELLKLSRMTDVLGDGERVDLKAVFDEVVEDLGSKLAEHRAELMVGGDLPEALANRSLVREAIQNLVENALKYGDPDAPRIRVEAVGAPWGRVAIAIEDNGPGIPEADRELVFRPFLRLTRDKERSDGVGAGLAIVQRIVSVHGGRIRIEDGEVLKGARFIVELSAFGALETLRD